MTPSKNLKCITYCNVTREEWRAAVALYNEDVEHRHVDEALASGLWHRIQHTDLIGFLVENPEHIGGVDPEDLAAWVLSENERMTINGEIHRRSFNNE